MKKIYMILAAMTLLSMSLNAQLILTEWTYPGSFPANWTVPSTGSGTVGGYYFGGSSGADIIIPTDDLQGYSTVTVKVTAAEENTYNNHSITVNGTSSSPALTTELVPLTWENVNASNGITIHVSDYYVNISAIQVSATVTNPLITASPTSISMNAAPSGNATETVTVAGYNLTGNITATLDDNSVFSVSPASLGTTGGTLTVTYSPTAAGDHSATLTLTSDGAEPVTINLTGSCIPGTTYELVTDPATQLVDSKKYIIVHGNYAMGALNSSNYGTLVDITDNGDNTVTVPGTASPMVLTLHNYSSNYTSGYSFQLENGNYLRGTSSYGSYYLTTATTANDYCSWTPVADVKSTGGYGIKMTYTYDTYRIGYRENGNYSNFGFYSTSNLTANSTSYFYGLLYVEVDNTPVLTAPVDDVHVGTLEEGGETSVSKEITVKGRNLTENLAVSVEGTGFSVTPATLTADAVNAGTTVTVTYTHNRDVNATGTLTIGSDEASTTVNLTATYISHDPVLTAPVDGSTVDVGTNAGDGVSKEITVSGNYLTQPLTVSVEGTGFSVEPTSISAEDANAGTTITVIYNGNDPNNPEATGTLTISSSEIGTVTVDLTASYAIVTGGHMIRLAIPVVDQFYASTATNTHPRGYGYVLKYEPTYGEKKESGRQEVPVQHTGSTVNGYYTKTQVDNDTDRKLTTDIMSADVDMTLSGTNTKVFYNTIQGKANALPAEYANYYTVLQRQSDGTFVEMKSPSPLTGKVYQSGEYHYYDSIPTTGSYGESFKTYVPVVMTMGQDRRYYEEDSLHNTYGAPIWKTGVGQVRMISTEAQMQRGPQGSTQWTDAQGNACSLYFLGVDAYGDLPSANVSNIVYEPYMFRVWIQSASNKLRGCTHVAAGVDPNKPGTHWDGDGTVYGSEPVCVYESTTEDGHLVLDVQSMEEGNNQPWGNKIQFGAVDNIDDLVIYVRFYYKSTGVAQEAVSTFMLGNRDEGIDYYAVEGSDEDADVTTSINGVYVDLNKTVDSVTYVNTQGMKSDKPFDGVNIVITRYTDGSVATTKVVK